MNDIDVLIRVAADAADGARGLDDVGQHARGMADDVERASREAARSLDGVGDAVDDTGGKASQLAGAFGDVAGGLGLIGLGGFSDELEAAAPALMLVAGAADIASVAMSTLSLAKIKDAAASVASKAASLASTAATGAQTAATWALNAALNANPVMLVVLAVVALVAILVLAYKKSDTFRAIVQAVGRAGRAAIGWIVDKVRDLVRWIGDTAPKAWNRMKAIALAALSVITTPIRVQIALFTRLVGWLKDKIPEAARALKKVIVPVFEAMTTPIRTVVNLVKDVVGWIKKIDLGPIEDVVSGISKVGGKIGGIFNRTAATDTTGTLTGSIFDRTNVTINNNVSGAIDPMGTARTLQSVQAAQLRRLGLPVATR